MVVSTLPDPDRVLFLATGKAWPDGEHGTASLLAALQERGIAGRIAVWNDPAVPWRQADLVAHLSTWDYHEHLPAFLQWTASLEPTRLLHAAQVVAWNAHKQYLRDLAAQGVPVVPTTVADTPEQLRAILDNSHTLPSVVKPASGASGIGVEVVAPGFPPDWTPLAAGPWVVQPFLPSVRTEGEATVFLIGGQLTGQLAKVPGAADFRIHSRYGGSASIVPVTTEAETLARRALLAAEAVLETSLVYARIDMLRDTEGQLVVSELEVIEPALSFDVFPQNVEAFADMVERRMGELKKTASSAGV